MNIQNRVKYIQKYKKNNIQKSHIKRNNNNKN